ncbi:hypothetical protein NMY22_g8365 [Coprinellus aureogranulatus]|nr:hypothetical protein NMY22_g8365 [Coprinellus aureogranulatus]
MGLVISLFHISKWLGAFMLQRLADRIAIGGPVAQKALHTSPELQDIPETMHTTSTAEEGAPTPVAHSSAAASSKAGGSADNPSSASPVALTPADVPEKAPSPRPSDEKGKAPARPSVNARFYLTDVQIERIDIAKEGLLPLSLTELRVISKPGQDSEEGTIFSLSQIPFGRWELTEFIPFPNAVDGIHCTIKGGHGEDVASVYLSSEEIGRSGQAGDRRGNDMRSSLSSSGLCLIFWWSVVDTAPMSSPSGAGEFIFNRKGGFHDLTPYTFFAPLTEAFARFQEFPQFLREKGHTSLANDVTALLDSAARSMRLFEETGDPTKKEDAIVMLKVVRQICQERLEDEDILEEAAGLRERGAALWERFSATGDLELVAEAIAVGKRACQLVPEGHKSLPRTLHNLSCSLYNRYKHTGNLSDLAEAISTQRRAIALAPDGNKDLPQILNSLGSLLEVRSKRTGEHSDLNEALSAQQRAVQLSAEDDPCLPLWLNGVGHGFYQRFVLTGGLSDLDEAISALERAVSLIPEGHESLPAMLTNLGNYLLERYQTTRNLPDLTEAISAQQRSVQLTPEGHPDLPSQFGNLGGSLMERFTHTRDPSDIARATSAHERAVDLTPDGHPDLPCHLFNLGIQLQCQGDLTGSWEVLSRTLSTFRLAATCTSGAPKDKLDAAKKWINLLTQHDPRSTDILVAFGVALGLVSLIGGLEQTVQGRHLQLQDVSGITLEAASAAFTFGHPDKALEWLEQGRCLVWNQLNGLRTPLDSLSSHDQGLAERVMKVSTRLEHAGSSRQHAGSTTSLQEKYRLEDEALEHVQAWLRNIPPATDFRHPASTSA